MPEQLPEIPSAEQLFDEFPTGLLLTRVDGTILKVNKTFCAWLGLQRDELVGKVRLQELFTMGGRIFHQTHWLPTLQMQGSLSEVKLDVRHKGGHTLPMMLNAIRRVRATGSYDEISIVVAEERNKYERELLAARKRADELVAKEREAQDALQDRALFAEQMVGIVSHDLRNPLSAILMGTKVLAHGEADPRRVRVLGHIDSSARRAQRLIEELLDFTLARVGRGLAVVRAPLDLHGLVTGIVDELALAFPDRDIIHRVEGFGECTADADRIAQLLGNLVGNAMTYGMAGGSVTVTSTLGARTAGLSVHNWGEPIPPGMQASVFDPMVRGDPGEGRARSVGLGLFIVRAIAAAHGGDVRVHSSLAAGTTFTFEFPRT